jgi:hypothetical protein
MLGGMAVDLTSVNAKLARAEEHFAAFGAEHAAWEESSAYETVREVDADFTKWTWKLRVSRQIDFTRGSLIFGDCVHALRCALDHLVYAIAVHQHQGPAPLDVGYAFNFPILYTGQDFAKTVKTRRLDILSEPVLRAIESVQAKARPHAADIDGEPVSKLTLLRDLNNEDKHHVIAQAYGLNGPAQFIHGYIPATFSPRGSISCERLDDGAEIATFTTDQPARYANPQLKAAIAICIRHPRWPNGGNFHTPGVMLELTKEVRQVVRIVSEAAT